MLEKVNLRCVASFTVDNALAKQLPDSVVSASLAVLKDPLRHRVLWVGETSYMPARLYAVLSQSAPLGSFIRDNAPESLGWQFFCYSVGSSIKQRLKQCVTRAVKPVLAKPREIPAEYETEGYLEALAEQRAPRYWW